MPTIVLRRGFNRIFVTLFIGWFIFCLFGYPVLMGREAQMHYDSDFKSCYEIYGVRGSADRGSLESCLSESKRELRDGTSSGFSFAWDEGEFWSLSGYYRHMGWMLATMIFVPPFLLYGSAWSFTALCRWIWRGFSSSASK